MLSQLLPSKVTNLTSTNWVTARTAFAVNTALVLAHIEIDEKSNEIPAVQKLLAELDVAGRIVTCDAMHVCLSKACEITSGLPSAPQVIP